MAEITATMVKELREKSGAGMLDCKKALAEADGDLQKAMNLLRERGAAIASKRSSRAAKEGLIAAYISPDRKSAGLIELNCESDFVARNEDFQALSKRLAQHAATTEQADNIQQSRLDGGETVEDAVKSAVGKIGENMVLSRATQLKAEGGLIYHYIHPPGKIGVLVEVRTGRADLASNAQFEEFARDIAMHVAASAPLCVRRDQVPSDTLANEKEVYRNQALNEGKPEKIVDKIVEGRVHKFYAESCLLEQPFAKNPDQKVEDYIKQAAGQLDPTVTVTRFVRYQLGQAAAAGESND